jgi:pimeloyl-ACP methyl ester carboxylesterase
VPADSAPASFAVTQLRVPALFIAGERDAIAIAPDVRQLHDSAAAPVRVYVELVGATHRTHGDARARYEREVLAFIQAVLSAAPPR